MKKLLTANLLFICLFAFTNCSKDDVAAPDMKSPETLAATKWDWVSWGYASGDEATPANPTTMHFIDGSNIERTVLQEDGQSTVTQFKYQISKDTLIAFEKTEVNYFLLKEHTATNLTLSRVKKIDLSTSEVDSSETGIFKYNKAAN